ncbi:MAG TPA: site-specific integrase [Terriglobia bacterium]|nr:site-specific integrase [Terriglobia bacterium]
MAEHHTILGGKVHVYKRPNSTRWQCSTYLAGRNRRTTTKEDSLSKAKEIADWYLQLRGKLRSGDIKSEKTFRDASEQYLREYDIITQGQRSKDYVKGQHWRSSVHLVPFFGQMGLSEITAGKIQEYRIHRHEEAVLKRGKPPAQNTMHQEIVTLRQTLKTAIPANTGLRPDEARRLQFRDVTIVEDEASDQTILEIEVRGKRGVGYCKSTHGAVRPFERLKARLRPSRAFEANNGAEPGPTGTESRELRLPEPADLIFPNFQRELFKTILDEENLRVDREGRPRTAYSLRHTYICLRLMEGADIYQIAKNCRTSVEMIEKFYAAHIKNMINAAAVNVRRAANVAPQERPTGRISKGAANAKRPRIRRK